MKKHILFSSLAILVPLLINGIAKSADLLPVKIGQKFVYTIRDSANPPNIWTAEFRVIEKVSMCSNDYFHLQLWNYSNQGEIEDHYNRSTENNIYVCDTDSGLECSTLGNGTVGTTWTCGEDFIEIMEPVEVSVPYGGPYTAVVNRKYNYVEESPHRFEYIVPGLGWVKQVDYWHDNPPSVLELTRICYDGEKCCFVDFPSGYWAEGYICKIYDEGITKGCSQNPLKYCPFDPVTRDQMAAFIVRAAEGEPDANYCATGSLFTDVSPDTWPCKYIKRLSELGITKGCGGTNYCPNRSVTRAEMAAFLIRAVEGEPPAGYCATGSPFTDVSPDTWPCKYIKRLKELEITKGCGPGIYCPNNNVTRAEMAAFLARAFLDMD